MYWHFLNHEIDKPVCHNCHVKEDRKKNGRKRDRDRAIARAIRKMF